MSQSVTTVPLTLNGLPVYGNWGGQEWSGGQVTTDGPLPAEIINVDPTNSLDALFKAHDLAYNTAQYYVTDPATRAADILAADIATKGVSFALLSEQSCHDAHALD